MINDLGDESVGVRLRGRAPVDLPGPSLAAVVHAGRRHRTKRRVVTAVAGASSVMAVVAGTLTLTAMPWRGGGQAAVSAAPAAEVPAPAAKVLPSFDFSGCPLGLYVGGGTDDVTLAFDSGTGDLISIQAPAGGPLGTGDCVGEERVMGSAAQGRTPTWAVEKFRITRGLPSGGTADFSTTYGWVPRVAMTVKGVLGDGTTFPIERTWLGCTSTDMNDNSCPASEQRMFFSRTRPDHQPFDVSSLDGTTGPIVAVIWTDLKGAEHRVDAA